MTGRGSTAFCWLATPPLAALRHLLLLMLFGIQVGLGGHSASLEGAFGGASGCQVASLSDQGPLGRLSGSQ